MDKQKAEAYEIIGNVICRVLLVCIVGVGWLIVVIKWTENPSWALTAGAVGGPVGMMKMLGLHFFPKQKALPVRPNRNKPGP